MNITLSIEELREYEDKMQKWFSERISNIEKTTLFSHERGGYETRFSGKLPFDEWIKQNPMPKLIPSV